MPTKPRARPVVLTQEQLKVADGIEKWYNDTNERHTSLGGYAGTGKTTLIRELVERLRPLGVFAPTGKAAHVLNTKGIKAGTLHGLLYHFKGKWQPNEWDDIKLIFEVNMDNDTQGRDECLVICDESSMINTEMFKDLMDFVNGRIIFVGDHGQLSPVGGDPGLMSNPRFKLETIMRQQLDNPIVAFAHMIRRGTVPKRIKCNTDDLSINPRMAPNSFSRWCLAHDIDQVIVGYNKDRRDLNNWFRANLGYTNKVNVGDRLICLLNEWDLGIFNGMILQVKAVHAEDSESIAVDVLSECGREFKGVQLWKEMLGSTNEKAVDVPKGFLAATYGYAITCHKAQGSEWHSVAVCDVGQTTWSPDRWRYTSATRGAERLHYFT